MDSRIGQQFGSYRLIRLLGRGGFAEVYLGEHIFLKDRRVAIKVLHTQMSSDDIQTFLKEGMMIADLKHPNILRVLDIGSDSHSSYYLAMEYAPGGSLRDQHPHGSILSIATILPYVKQIAKALQHAHNQRIIHRDVKPENMLIGLDGRIMLSDFGIATLVSSTSSLSNQSVTGTVSYMAPEQFQARPGRASDQYALGVVVYEWLCGTRPFTGSFTEVAAQHLLSQPPSLRERVPTLSKAIEEVVLKALTKDPSNRFSSIQDFAQALEQASASNAQGGHIPEENIAETKSLPTRPSSVEEAQDETLKNFPPILEHSETSFSIMKTFSIEEETRPFYLQSSDSSAQESVWLPHEQTEVFPESDLPENKRKDFFISYNKTDREWAMWIAACLQDAGYSVLLPPVDFRMGFVFKNEMQKAFAQAKRMLVTFSPAYLAALKSRSSGLSSFKRSAAQKQEALLSVCVHDHDAMLAEISAIANYIDLTGEPMNMARAVLLAYIHGEGIELSSAIPVAPDSLPGFQLQTNFSGVFMKTASTSFQNLTEQTPKAEPAREQETTPGPFPNGIEVFFSYSHKDESMRQELETHLSNLKRQRIITGWHDGEIRAGDVWEEEIEAHLSSAHIILLLISPDFINSNYCYEKEMLRAMLRHKAGEAHVVPIILRPAHWERTPFGKLQALPPGARALTLWENRDEAFVHVARGLQRVIDDLTRDAASLPLDTTRPAPEDTTGAKVSESIDKHKD